MKRYVIYLACLLASSGCGMWPFARKSADSEKQADRERRLTQRGIDKIRNDDALYYGENSAMIVGGDRASAADEAKKRAKEQLSSNIESIVRITITDRYGKKKGESIDDFEKETKTYSNMILKDIQERPYYDFPREGMVTYFVWVSKEKYDRYMQEEIQKKIRNVVDTIETGLDEIKKNNYLLAIEHLQNAKKLYQNNFGSSLREAEIQGKKRELSSFIDNTLKNIASNISIIPLTPNATFTSAGKLKQALKVKALYEGKEPIVSAPLIANFTKGGSSEGGQLMLTTIAGGIGRLGINTVEPGYEEHVIEVRLDVEKLKLGADIGNIASCRIIISRSETVAISAISVSGSKKSKRSSLTSDIKEVIQGAGKDVVEYELMGNTISAEDRRHAKDEMYVDYLLSVELVEGSLGGPDPYDMYWAYASGKAIMISLDSDYELFSLSVPRAKGEGPDASSAVNAAFSKIQPAIFQEVKSKLQEQLK